MKRTILSLLTLLLVVSLSSCHKELPIKTVDQSDPNFNIANINVPQDFKFETATEVTLNIGGFKSSSSTKVKYDIYLYNPDGEIITTTTVGDDGLAVTETMQAVDALSNLAASYITDAASFDIKLTIPNFYKSIYIIKNDRGVFSSMILPVNSNKMSVIFPSNEASFKSTKATTDTYTVDMIYGVNSSSDVFQINTETGELKIISKIPEGNGGSHTCAIDPVRKILYAVGLTKPYNLLAYDINADTWTTIDATGIYGPRLSYNIADGLLYYSYDDRFVKMDPSNAKILATYRIRNLDAKDGGDIAHSADGSLYMSTTSGIYHLTYSWSFWSRSYNSELISGSITNYPSALAFGYDDTFWWATNIDGKGQIFTFDLDNAEESSHFSPFDISIDDIAVLPIEVEEIIEADSDNDGIIDIYDDYPNDAERATDVYTPSITGLGSYAFEDLWPYQGDYDFNDLIVNYRFLNVANSEGLVVETKMYFFVKNIGGSFHNGFGIELNIDKNLINQVTGHNLTEGIISMNGQGLENNQDKAVIIAFDNSHNIMDTNNGVMELIISYTQPVNPDAIGTFNPFIFINGERGREVHLADFSPTTLADTSLFGSGDDNSNAASGSYYKNSNNLPWGINILYDFTMPVEKSPINKGYIKFVDWATSGGTEFDDWYSDIDDYRDYTYLIAD
ncbi:MAG: LruC domain-containing protein [Bacteroidales bacterium]|nr:LruC domain-containing protein [Bacteroidales bacterium]